MKTASLLTAACLSVCASAFAQVPVDPAPAISAEQRAAVSELLGAMDFRKTMSQMSAAMTKAMPQMFDQMFEGMLKANPKLTAEQREAARKMGQEAQAAAMSEMAGLYDDPEIVRSMEDIMGRAYGKRFSAPEIRSITAFYLSPVGRKVLDSLPSIMQETMPEMMQAMQPRMMAVMAKVSKDVAARLRSTTGAQAADTPK